jgi:hypothetical protein
MKFTCIKCEFPFPSFLGNVDERMCNDCLESCEHENTEYQAQEIENNVPEDYYCLDCGEQLAIPEPDYGV